VTGRGTYNGVGGMARLGRVVSPADREDDDEDDNKITIEFAAGAYDRGDALATSQHWDDFYLGAVVPGEPHEEELAEWMLTELSI
jgi:hypothetical protein